MVQILAQIGAWFEVTWTASKDDEAIIVVELDFATHDFVLISTVVWGSVIQIHMNILQHSLHQNYDVKQLLISYLTVRSSLLELDANYLFVKCY